MDWLRRYLSWLFVTVLIVLLNGSLTDLNAKTVTLSWDPSPTPTVTGYVINVLSTPLIDSTEQEVDVGNVLTRTIQGLEDTDENWFCVRAYDGEGHESVCSNIVYSPAIVAPLPVLDLEFDVELLME